MVLSEGGQFPVNCTVIYHFKLDQNVLENLGIYMNFWKMNPKVYFNDACLNFFSRISDVLSRIPSEGTTW